MSYMTLFVVISSTLETGRFDHTGRSALYTIRKQTDSTMAVTTESLLGPTTGQLILEIDQGDGQSRTYGVSDAKCSIGSDERCGIRIQGEGIRPVHCVILRSHDRTIVRRWAGNTWLNGQPFDDATLRRADELRLANVRIRVVRDERIPSQIATNPGVARLREALATQADSTSSRRRGQTMENSAADLPVAKLVERLESAEAQVQHLQERNDVNREDSDRHDSQLARRIATLETLLANAAPEQSTASLSSDLLGDDSQPQVRDERQAWQQEKTEFEQALADANCRISEIESDWQTQERTLERIAVELKEVEQARDSAEQACEDAERARDSVVTELDEIRARGDESVGLDERETIWQAKFDELEAEREAEEAVNKQYQDDQKKKVNELSQSVAESEQEIDEIRQQLVGKRFDLEEMGRQLEEKVGEIAELKTVDDNSEVDRITELQGRWAAESKMWEDERALLAEQIAAHELAANGVAERTQTSANEREELAARNAAITLELDETNAAREDAIATREEAIATRDAIEVERDEAISARAEITAERDALEVECDEIAAECDQLKVARDEHSVELGQIATEREEIAAELAQQVKERDEFLAERDEATRKRDEALQELDDLVKERDEFCFERQNVTDERDAALKHCDQLATERGELLIERDAAIAKRNGAASDRDELVVDRDRLNAERDELAKERDELVTQRDETANERDGLSADRDEAVSKCEELAAERTELVNERDESALERDRLAEQIATIRQDDDAVASEVEQQRQELARDRAEIEQQKQQLKLDREQLEADRLNAAQAESNAIQNSSVKGYVDVALDYTSQVSDDAGLAEIAPGLIDSTSAEDGSESSEDDAALRFLDSFNSEDSPTLSPPCDESGDNESEGPLPDGEDFAPEDDSTNQFGLDLDSETPESDTIAEHPAPVSDDEEIEESGRSCSPVEDDSIDDDWNGDEDGDWNGDEDEDEDQTAANVFTEEHENNTQDFLSQLGEKPDFGLSTDESGETSTSDAPWSENPVFSDDEPTGSSEQGNNTQDFLSQLGEKPDFGLSADESGESTSEAPWTESHGFADGEPTGSSEQGNNTQDFLSQLGEKPDFGLSAEEPGESTSEAPWAEANGFADDEPTDSSEQGNNTQDFLSQLGEKPDFGLSADESGESTSEAPWTESHGLADGEPTGSSEQGNNTQDFLSQLGEKPDFGLSADESGESTSEAPWTESHGFADGEPTGSSEQGNNTQDFLSQLGEKPDFGLFADDESPAAVSDSALGESSLFDDEELNPTSENLNNTQDFLSQLGEKPDFGLSDDSNEDMWGESTTDEASQSSEPNGTLGFLDRLGEKPDFGMSSEADAEADLDEWGLPVQESIPTAAESDAGGPDGLFAEEQTPAHPDDLVSTPEQEFTPVSADSDGDGSIEDYMNNLLARVGGGGTASGSAPTPPPAAKSVAPLAPETPSKSDDAAAGQTAMSPSEFVPRTRAPEENLAAMRELANASTRSAIKKSQKARTGMSLVTNVGISLIPVLMGMILMVFGLKGRYFLMVTGIVFSMVGLFMIYKSFTSLGRNKETAVEANAEKATS